MGIGVCVCVRNQGRDREKGGEKAEADLRFSLQNWKTTIKLQWNKVCITFNKFPHV